MERFPSKAACVLASAAVLLIPIRAEGAEGNEVFDFFAEEAQVITASRQAQPLSLAPATAYVVTAADIEASGAQTLWDALRGVPGVDVMVVQTFQGEVSIRGLNKALNNRVLVLLDGNPVLRGYFDRVAWDALPVGKEEIDRIEVVEGPVSALYGPNAILGVINLITKTPDQLTGGVVRLAAGERQTYMAHALYGGRRAKLSGKISTGLRSTNRFESPDRPASDVGWGHVYAAYTPSDETFFSMGGAFSAVSSRAALGGFGVAIESGPSGYLRADFKRRRTWVRAFWDRNRTHLEDPNLPEHPGQNADTYKLSLEHTVALPRQHTLTVGASYRSQHTASPLLSLGPQTQDLWSAFFEHQWRPKAGLLFVGSGRLDRHPLAAWAFSPRGSLVYSPVFRHVFRVSAGTAFRFPTQTESNSLIDRPFVLGGAEAVGSFAFDVTVRGNPELKAEQMRMLELGYTGRMGRAHVHATGFLYRLKNVIASTLPELVLLPDLHVSVSFENRTGETRARGGELGLRVDVTPHVSASANYAYLDLDEVRDPLASTNGGPRHKLNAGLRFRSGRLMAGAWVHRVGETFWFENSLVGDLSALSTVEQVDAYTLVNAQVGYAFRGELSGLKLSVSVFNLFDTGHFETLEKKNDLERGQNGRIILRRAMAGVSYAF